MDEPNLQCVPKPRAYKVLLSSSQAAAGSDADEASGHALRTANLRAAFVAPPGCVLLSGGWTGGGKCCFPSTCLGQGCSSRACSALVCRHVVRVPLPVPVPPPAPALLCRALQLCSRLPPDCFAARGALQRGQEPGCTRINEHIVLLLPPVCSRLPPD